MSKGWDRRHSGEGGSALPGKVGMMDTICQNCGCDLSIDLGYLADDMNAHCGYRSITNKIKLACPECGAIHEIYAHWTIDRIESIEQIGWQDHPIYDTLEEKRGLR